MYKSYDLKPITKEEFKEEICSGLKLKEDLHKQVCPCCNGHDIGVNSWGMFKGLRDWFYFCRDCGFNWQHEDTPQDFKLV